MDSEDEERDQCPRRILSTEADTSGLIQGVGNCTNKRNTNCGSSTEYTEESSICSDRSQSLLPLVLFGGADFEVSAPRRRSLLTQESLQQALSRQEMENGGGGAVSQSCGADDRNEANGSIGREGSIPTSERASEGSSTSSPCTDAVAVAAATSSTPPNGAASSVAPRGDVVLPSRPSGAREADTPSESGPSSRVFDPGLSERHSETAPDQSPSRPLSSRPGERDTNRRTTSMHDGGGSCKFKCSICFEAPMEPVVTVCGHLYCWQCLRAWMAMGAARCPVCKAGVSEKNVIPVYGSDEGPPSPTGSSTSTPDGCASNIHDPSGVRRRAHAAATARAGLDPSTVPPNDAVASPERPRAERPPVSSSSSSSPRASGATTSAWAATLHGVHFGFSPFGLGIHFDAPFRPSNEIPLTREQRSHLVSAFLIIFGISILFWAVFAGATSISHDFDASQHVS